MCHVRARDDAMPMDDIPTLYLVTADAMGGVWPYGPTVCAMAWVIDEPLAACFGARGAAPRPTQSEYRFEVCMAGVRSHGEAA